MPFKYNLNKPIVILGMHRSGTTMLSKVLDKAGVFQGVFKDHNNEAFHFLSLNQKSLHQSEFSWINPGEPDSKYWTTISQEELISLHFSIQSLHPLKQRLLYNKPWGWKDPRNTFTLKMWLSIFPEARVINVIRNGCDVAMSLAQRNKVIGEVYSEKLNDLAFNFRLWEKYMGQAERLRPLTKHWLDVKYEDLITQDNKTVYKLNGFIGNKIDAALNQFVHTLKPYNYPQELQELASKSTWYKKWYLS